MQHHFVVFYDDETNEWSIDAETTSTRFDEGNVWTNKSNKSDCWIEWNKNTNIALNKLHDIFLDANEENN